MLSRFAPAFAHVFGPIYDPGELVRYTLADNGKGGVTGTPTRYPCKVQLDDRMQRDGGPGYPETDGIALILAKDLPGVQDDDEIETGGLTFRISAPSLDPLGTHYRCNIRRKP